MQATFTQDQDMIRSTTAAFLTDWQKAGGFRRLSDTSRTWDKEAWKTLAVELGFAGLTIPEAQDGAGLGAIERALVMEEMGRVLFMSPFFSTCVLVSDVLVSVQTERANAYLSSIAQGNITACLAVLEQSTGAGGALTGRATNVIDGADSDIIFVKTPDTLFAVNGDAPGLTRRSVPTLDRTRAIADLTFENVVAEDIAAGPDLHNRFDVACARSAIALSAEQIGGAEAMLNATVSYVLERKQFGRLIGSFQAVKHRCADMMTRIETARSAVYLAAAMAEREELFEYAAIAKSESSDAYFKTTGDAIQMHGGVGVTWEYDMHFHFKRARAGLDCLGTPEAWREKLAGMIGLNGAVA